VVLARNDDDGDPFGPITDLARLPLCLSVCPVIFLTEKSTEKLKLE